MSEATDKARKLLSARSSPEPWKYMPCEEETLMVFGDPPVYYQYTRIRAGDAAFICGASQVIEDLLAEISALEGKLTSALSPTSPVISQQEFIAGSTSEEDLLQDELHGWVISEFAEPDADIELDELLFCIREGDWQVYLVRGESEILDSSEAALELMKQGKSTQLLHLNPDGSNSASYWRE